MSASGSRRARPSGRWIEDWDPENEAFWRSEGKRIARRNLAFSIGAEFLGFSVWVLWSVTAAYLNRAGFDLSTGQLYTLVAVPALVGATVRIPYTLAVSRFGGRNWTVASALVLLVPLGLHGLLVTNPSTPFWALLLGAASAGLGGGNFASSMSNISQFYPDRKKGFALGVNAAGGNLGVAVSQALTPLVVGWAWLAVGPGGSGSGQDRGRFFLQNASLLWLPFVLLAAACAWRFMDNLRVGRAPLLQQMAAVRRRHTWSLTFLYVATFGSFVGYSAGFPLLIKTEFPRISLSLAFLGPLVGALTRPVGGWLGDRLGGARLTLATLVGMISSSSGLWYFLQHKQDPRAFGFFMMLSVLLFAFTGLGNGAIYQMIPAAFRTFHLERGRAAGEVAEGPALIAARVETSAAVGFIGAVGAYGGWLVPQTYGLSISVTGSPLLAIELITGLYLVAVLVVWRCHLRTDVRSTGLSVVEMEA